jgi:hypothetical protein
LDTGDVRGLLGLLLADGSLVSYRTPTGGYVQMILTAGITESAFLQDKVDEFRRFVPTKAEIVPYRTGRPGHGKTTTVLRFRVSTDKLRPVYNLLYPGGDRMITSACLELLGARAAAWLWAEGARPHGDGVYLARVGFSLYEAELVSQWLETISGAISSISEQWARPRLWLEAEQAEKLKSALWTYAPNSRRHLFLNSTWDVSSIRSARTELLLGGGLDQPEGSASGSLAGVDPVRTREDLPAAPGTRAAATA